MDEEEKAEIRSLLDEAYDVEIRLNNMLGRFGDMARDLQVVFDKHFDDMDRAMRSLAAMAEELEKLKNEGKL